MLLPDESSGVGVVGGCGRESITMVTETRSPGTYESASAEATFVASRGKGNRL